MVERCRMKLHEFHVCDRCSGAVCHRYAIPGCDARIGRMVIDPPDSTGCEKGYGSKEELYLAAALIKNFTPVAGLLPGFRVNEEFTSDVILEYLYIRIGFDRRDQSSFDGSAGVVCGMHDPLLRMSPLLADIERLQLALISAE